MRHAPPGKGFREVVVFATIHTHHRYRPFWQPVSTAIYSEVVHFGKGAQVSTSSPENNTVLFPVQTEESAPDHILRHRCHSSYLNSNALRFTFRE